ncbi:G5 domain-containing protein [Neobacillus sp. 114]|uniref:G5 domain-containing protein n=1 Tax=Neobacillus sp. 114 TaxID=3048535 RepID=UPI0024C263F2|nr:G5 domain-containing protein [Neobacillus sp. 114]
MGKNQQMIKLFVVLFFSTAFIFSFSHFGARAFERLSNADGKFSGGTTICALDVSDKTPDEAIALLEEKYVNWIKDASMELKYGEKTAPFDLNLFELDTKTTVASIKEGQNNPVYMTVTKSQVEEQLQILFPQIKMKEIDFDKLTYSLNETALLFEPGSHTFNIYDDYLLADKIDKDTVIATSVVRLNEMPGELVRTIMTHSKIEILAEKQFSLLAFAKEQKITDNKVLNILATGIYQAILPSNFTVIERNIGNTLPDYANLGYEAKVNQAEQADLLIFNPNKLPYFLEFTNENNSLKVTLKGQKFLYDYKIIAKDEQKLEPKTIIQYSPQISPGKTKVQNNGTEGKLVKIYREVYQGGQLVKSEFLSEDYYPPVYKVVIQGLTSASPSSATTQTGLGDTSSGTTDSNQTTDSSYPMPTTSDSGQQESDIWGKPNEQPK